MKALYRRAVVYRLRDRFRCARLIARYGTNPINENRGEIVRGSMSSVSCVSGLDTLGICVSCALSFWIQCPRFSCHSPSFLPFSVRQLPRCCTQECSAKEGVSRISPRNLALQYDHRRSYREIRNDRNEKTVDAAKLVVACIFDASSQKALSLPILPALFYTREAAADLGKALVQRPNDVLLRKENAILKVDAWLPCASSQA